MEIITTLLANPKILGVLGISGTLLLGFCVVMYRLYLYQRKKYEEILKKNEDLQETRVQENRQMQKEFYDLAADMDKTLDSVLKAIRNKSNGDK